jgi:pimeloyl-ACP methyl ester carboxylesterase
MAGHRPTIVLVHGAWFGSWVWAEMSGRLETAGIAARTIDLPGARRAPGRRDLAGHSSALRSLVASVEGPVAVCAHSYGGVVASQALGGLPNLATLIFVAAFMIEPGRSAADAAAEAASLSDQPLLVPTLEGKYLSMPPAAAGQALFADCAPGQISAAAARLTPEHVGAFTAPLSAAAWRDVPSTYIVARRDRAISPAAQTLWAKNAAWQDEIDSDHSPMLSHPDELATRLAAAVRRGVA